MPSFKIGTHFTGKDHGAKRFTHASAILWVCVQTRCRRANIATKRVKASEMNFWFLSAFTLYGSQLSVQ